MDGKLSIGDEFVGLDLGDERRNARAAQIVTRLVESPSQSFPKLTENASELEALYRFFQNDSVSPSAILKPHTRATAARCMQHQLVRVAHDTSAFRFSGDREGMGSLGRKGHGFFAHFSLAIGSGEMRTPLGVLGLRTFIRTEATRRESKSERALLVRDTPREDKESARWLAAVADVAAVGAGVPMIHVMDQEADDYALFAELMERGDRFVIRGSADRRLKPRPGSSTLRDRLEEIETTFFRTVALAERSKPLPGHTQRGEREAHLHVRGLQVEIKRPSNAQSKHESLIVNVVQVLELEAPENEEPVEWTLVTTEPIATAEDLGAVVDHYRSRWRIEEYFRALKTGCCVEQRQLTERDSLERVLALFVPVAWRLLALRTLSRLQKPPPAETLFSHDDLAVIEFLARRRKHRLPTEATVRDVMLALAAIGGHLKRNGDPGWITIGRGYDDFCLARAVWAARGEK